MELMFLAIWVCKNVVLHEHFQIMKKSYSAIDRIQTIVLIEKYYSTLNSIDHETSIFSPWYYYKNVYRKGRLILMCTKKVALMVTK